MRRFTVFLATALLCAFQPAIAVEPTADGAYQQGLKYLDRADFPTALRCFHLSLSIDPTYTSSYCKAGQTLVQTEQPEKAIALLTQGIALCAPSSRLFYERCQAFYCVGKMDLALADIDRAIEMTPENPYDWVKRGQLESAAHDNQNALRDFNKALDAIKVWKPPKEIDQFELGRTRCTTELEIGNIYQSMGKFSQAAEAYSAALAVPEVVMHREKALTNRAECYEKLGKRQLAEADRKAAADSSSNVFHDLLR
ncbi:MAG TPA: tetratricopeptide repeat protein [Planktothrix sp.]|jgi:tetratricopeptide (TPR) repeat protein